MNATDHPAYVVCYAGVTGLSNYAPTYPMLEGTAVFSEFYNELIEGEEKGEDRGRERVAR